MYGIGRKLMSIEERRRLRKKSKETKEAKGKKAKKQRANPKKELTPEEIEARKKAQRTGMFEKRKKFYKK